MSFNLGGFAEGLTDGAKTTMSLYNTYSDTESRNEHTRAEKQRTDIEKSTFDAGKTMSEGSSTPAPAALPAADVTPSDTGTGGGTTGTISSDPVAPTSFDTLPTPSHMQGVDTTTPAAPAPAPAPPAPPPTQSALPTNAPVQPEAPSLAGTVSRAASGFSAYAQSFGDRAKDKDKDAVRPITETDPTRPNSAINTNTPYTASPNQTVPVAAMRTYDMTPSNMGTNPPRKPGPNLGVVTNRPVGTAVKDWWNGTTTPEAPSKYPSKAQHSSANNIGRHLAGALNIG